MADSNRALLANVAQVAEQAEQLHSAADIDSALAKMAAQINSGLAVQELVVLCLMNGGLVTTGMLLPRLTVPVRLDYVHATRYRNALSGDQLQWFSEPHLEFGGHTVLIIDDIFDEGHTLAAVSRDCVARGASAVHSAVLVDKQHARKVAGFKPDFIGLQVPDRFVFGSGMDYKGYLRNMPGIFALAE